MVHVSSAEVQKQFGRYRETALSEPVIVQQHGRDSVAIISVTEYERLKKLDRKVRALEELSEAEFDQIARSAMSTDHVHLNALLED